MGSKEVSVMKFSVQVDDLKLLNEALATECDKVRFGAEFCEWKVPSLKTLKTAYDLTVDAGKQFDYITPRCSDKTIKRILDHLSFLNDKGEIKVIINDIGFLNVLKRYERLIPHLGRQLIHIPARCPWFYRDSRSFIFFGFMIKAAIMRRHVKDLYNQTSLHYEPTIRFYKEYGFRGLDLDWIPRCFPHYKFFVDQGLDVAVHTHLVPVTVTRKCHTARFLGEKNPQNCSKPCNTRAFLLKHEGVFMTVKLFLHGNAVFTLTQPTKKDVKNLLRAGATELVITMNPVTNTLSRERVNEVISSIKQMF